MSTRIEHAYTISVGERLSWRLTVESNARRTKRCPRERHCSFLVLSLLLEAPADARTPKEETEPTSEAPPGAF